MLNKLKYIGMKRDDLVLIYKTYIRCVLEYCCVVWSSSLTAGQKDSLERVQKVCVKVILGKVYTSYPAALETCKLLPLEERRENLCLSFGKKCLKSAKHTKLFPQEERQMQYNLRATTKFKIKPARTEKYKKSAIPYIQRLLNK